MELTRLGVVIDPTEAEAGAKRATRAADAMAKSMVDDLNKVEKESKEAGKAVDAAGRVIETSARGATQSIDRLGEARGFERLRQGVGSSFGEIRRMVIDALDVFGLLNNGIGDMIRRGDSLLNLTDNVGRGVGGMGRGAAGAAGGMDDLAAGTASAAAGAGRLLAGLGPLIAILAAVGAAILAAVVAAKALGVAFRFTIDSVKEAAALEQYTVRLAVLQGSFDKARESVKRFNEFSDATPFTDAEVFDAGTKLEAMSKGILSTDEALRAIGGSAFVAGKSFSDIADLVGRAYNAMRLGMDFIEPLKTMNSYGLIAGETVKEVIRLGEEAEKTGNKAANFAQQWALVYGDLSTKQEALLLASDTWEGKMSTIQGKWSALKATFGEPIMNALKPLLDDVLLMIQVLTPLAAELGAAIGNALKAMVQLFHEGNLGEVFQAVLFDTIESAGRFMLLTFLEAAAAVGNALVNLFLLPLRLVADGFKALMADPGMVTRFATKLKDDMIDAVNTFGNYLLEKASAAGTAIRNSLMGAVTGFSAGGIAGAAGSIASSAEGIVGSAAAKIIGAGIGEATAAAVGAKLPEAAPAAESSPEFVGPPKPTPPTDYFSTSLFPTDWLEQQALVNTRTQEVLQGAIQRFDAANPPGEITQPVTPPSDALSTPTPSPGIDGGAGSAGAPSASAKPIESITEALQEQRSAVQTLADDWGNLQVQGDQAIASLVQGITGEMSNAITDAIMGTKTWQEAFEQLGAAVVKQIIQMVTQLWIQYTVSLLLKNLGGAFGGGAGLFGGAGAAILHSGGTTEGAPRRSGGLPLYHGGGRASSERIAMLEKDETVLTAEQGTEIRDRLRKSASRKPGSGGGGGQGTGVTILNVTDASQVTEAIAANPDIVINAINRRLPAVRRLVQGGERR